MSLLSRSVLRTALVKAPSPAALLLRREMTILSKESGEHFKKQNYTARQKASGRPVSPHLTIYSFPLGALSSITNRITGVSLSLGCAGLGLAELTGSGNAMYMMQSIGSMESFFYLGPTKFLVVFPLVYHFGASVRHAIWDYKPEMLNNKDVGTSSYYLMIGSVVVSVPFMFM